MELSIAAILSHSVQEGKPSPGEPSSKEEAPGGGAAPEPAGSTEPSEPSEPPPTENVMVTHVRAATRGLGILLGTYWDRGGIFSGVWYDLVSFVAGFIITYYLFLVGFIAIY